MMVFTASVLVLSILVAVHNVSLLPVTTKSASHALWRLHALRGGSSDEGDV